jgi:phosphocarrier protein
LNDNEADAASILGIIALAAGKGSFVDLRVEGPDESETLEAVSELFINGFGER